LAPTTLEYQTRPTSDPIPGEHTFPATTSICEVTTEKGEDFEFEIGWVEGNRATASRCEEMILIVTSSNNAQSHGKIMVCLARFKNK
jgi:hypothetical protein